MPGLLPDLLGFQYEAIRPQASRRNAIQRLVLLTWGENPTFDYYIRPRLDETPAVVVDMAGDVAGDVVLGPGDYVLVCRYLNRRWARRIAAARDLAGVGFFFDDDYVAFLADKAVPLLYRLDVAARTAWPLRVAGSRITDVFVSTPLLRERYGQARATVLHPSAGAPDLAPAARESSGPVRIAFHAQLSHLADHALAASIAHAWSGRSGDVIFDVIGPPRARHHWAEFPFARFRTEMSWPEYRRLSREEGADILIAPMLDTPLNRARAPTKAIDAVRMGAAAVLPRSPAYGGLGDSAVLAEGTGWHEALRTLVERPDIRRRQAEALRREVESWSARARPWSQVLACDH